MKVNKAILILCFTLFFPLLAWPMVIFIAYMAFYGPAKIVFIISLFSIEIILGAFLLTWAITNRKTLSRGKLIASLVSVGLPYIAYLSSMLYLLVLS